MNRQSIADKIRAAGQSVGAWTTELADKIDPPTFGVKLVWDDNYSPAESWALGTDQENALAIAEEEAKLASGEWTVLGMIAYERDSHGVERETPRHASLWGIVVTSDELPGWLPGGGGLYVFGDDLAELGPYLRSVADDLRAEAGV